MSFSLVIQPGGAEGRPAKRSRPAREVVKLEVLDQPSFSVSLVPGTMKAQGTPDEGLINVKTPPADQLVYWNLIKVSLQERGVHERDLIVEAGKRSNAKVVVGELAEGRAGGKRAMSWSASLDATVMRSTVVECPMHHVLLTTMGKDAAEVEETHGRSMKSFKCKGSRR